jgi:hypothetical protein
VSLLALMMQLSAFQKMRIHFVLVREKTKKSFFFEKNVSLLVLMMPLSVRAAET